MTKPIHPQIEKLFTEKTGSFQFNINYSWRNNQELFDFCYDIWQKAQDEILDEWYNWINSQEFKEMIIEGDFECCHAIPSFIVNKCKELQNRKEKKE
jgi:hypothetical protein